MHVHVYYCLHPCNVLFVSQLRLSFRKSTPLSLLVFSSGRIIVPAIIVWYGFAPASVCLSVRLFGHQDEYFSDYGARTWQKKSKKSSNLVYNIIQMWCLKYHWTLIIYKANMESYNNVLLHWYYCNRFWYTKFRSHWSNQKWWYILQQINCQGQEDIKKYQHPFPFLEIARVHI